MRYSKFRLCRTMDWSDVAYNSRLNSGSAMPKTVQSKNGRLRPLLRAMLIAIGCHRRWLLGSNPTTLS